MSDDQDPRIDHIKESAVEAMNLKINDWKDLIWKEESIATLKDFFESPDTNLLLLHFDRNKKLAFSLQVPKNITPLKKPLCIFLKNILSVTLKNYKKALSFYSIFKLPFKEIEVVFEKAASPTSCFPLNNQRWPGEISQDISYYFQHLRTSISYHAGLAGQRTVLLIPEYARLIEDYDMNNVKENDISDLNLRNIINSITDMLSNWIPIVRDVLELTPEQVFSREKLGPSSEIKFWEDREKNLQFIYSQVNDPLVRNMVLALEKVNSSYFPKFRIFLQEIAEGLDEAKEICSKFGDMQAVLDDLDCGSIPDFYESLPNSMDTITKSWMESNYYKTVPSYVTILLKKVSCLLIDKTSEYLMPITLFKEDRHETTEKVRLSARVVDMFLHWYDQCREQFDSKPYPWVFPDIRVFTQFGIFIDRLNQIKDVFNAADVYSKVPYEKLINVQQASFRKRIVDLQSLFFEAYEKFELSTYNALDLDTEDFVNDYNEFSEKLKDLDSKMGIVVGQVCLSYLPAKDAFKFFDVVHDILKRPFVLKDFVITISSYAYKVYKEVLTSQEKYSTYPVQEECDKLVYKNLSPVSGAVQWLTDECFRILPPFEKLEKYFHDFATYKYTLESYGEVVKLLSEFEKYVSLKWEDTLHIFTDKIHEKVFIIDRENVYLNFNHLVAEVCLETRYLMQIQKFELLPAHLLEYYAGYEKILIAQSLLACSTKWYNELQTNLVQNEKTLIATVWERITFLINEGIDKTWIAPDLFSYAEELYSLTCKLYGNMEQAKRNITKVLESIDQWTCTPLFVRENSETMVDFTVNLSPPVEKQMVSVLLSALLLNNALADNLGLFESDPGSDEEIKYAHYMESLFETGLKKSISCNLQYIFENTNPSNTKMAPFYKVSLILNGDLKYVPPLTMDESGNIFEIFENVIEKIYSPAEAIKRLIDQESTYYDALCDSEELNVLNSSIMDNISSGAEKALEKGEIFYQYSDMWEMSVDEVLGDFVLYGPVQEIPDEDGVYEEREPELKPPTEDEFKAQILEFEQLYKKVEDTPVVLEIESWLVMDVSDFKKSLLSTILNWSAAYKKKLMEMKRLGKLRKLEDDSDM